MQVFSTSGYRGSTVDQIAAQANMSKARVLYYFGRKQDIYLAVLEQTLTSWLNPLLAMHADGDPIEEIGRYIFAKLALSRSAPLASRLFANEILHGAPMIKPFLQRELQPLVVEKCAILQKWIDEEKLAAINPLHLLFLIWSATQHYADFVPQIEVLHSADEDQLYRDAETFFKTVVLNGLRGPALL